MNFWRWIYHLFGISKETDEYKRTQSPAYRRRLDFVKDLWIGSGLIMLAVAQPAFILAFTLFVTFLSFAFLEE